MVVDQPITWSPLKKSPPRAKPTWSGVWPGVVTAVTDTSPSETVSPSPTVRSIGNRRSVCSGRGVGLGRIKFAGEAGRPLGDDGGAYCLDFARLHIGFIARNWPLRGAKCTNLEVY